MSAKRKPLAVGNKYSYGSLYPGSGFEVKSVQLPDRSGYDGGVAGVAVQMTLGTGEQRQTFYLVGSEAEFWTLIQFKNAIDAEVE